ncbi:MAG TPA: CARDB domain-containing protein [Methanotrichaceae archaeon]|nr:CARDB domain-containing protein [Methanotrichaceae archaeon]
MILVAAGLADAAEKPPVIAVKPDIVIKDLSIDRTGVTPAGNKVLVSVTVLNAVPGTSTGPFKIQVEWTEDPTAGFTLLGTSGVSNLINDPSMAAVRGETRTFEHVVPNGKAYKYRVTADFMNQVAEANEANNVDSAGYIAR